MTTKSRSRTEGTTAGVVRFSKRHLGAKDGAVVELVLGPKLAAERAATKVNVRP